jgi:hypothetical protein
MIKQASALLVTMFLLISRADLIFAQSEEGGGAEIPACSKFKMKKFWNNCFGEMKNDQGVYEGTFVDGQMNGYGTFSWKNGMKYVGEFSNGLHGQGTFTWPDGSVYVGQFTNDRLTGDGKLTYPSSFEDGAGVYVGSFVNWKRHGLGKWVSDSFEFEGEWKDGKPVNGLISLPSGETWLGDVKADWSSESDGVGTHADGVDAPASLKVTIDSATKVKKIELVWISPNECELNGQSFVNLTVAQMDVLSTVGASCSGDDFSKPVDLVYGDKGFVEIDGKEVSYVELVADDKAGILYRDKPITLYGYIYYSFDVRTKGPVYFYGIDTKMYAGEDLSGKRFKNQVISDDFMVDLLIQPSLEDRKNRSADEHQEKKVQHLQTLSKVKSGAALVKVRGTVQVWSNTFGLYVSTDDITIISEFNN